MPGLEVSFMTLGSDLHRNTFVLVLFLYYLNSFINTLQENEIKW